MSNVGCVGQVGAEDSIMQSTIKILLMTNTRPSARKSLRAETCDRYLLTVLMTFLGLWMVCDSNQTTACASLRINGGGRT